MKRKSNQSNPTQNNTMIKLVNQDIKRVITMFYIFKNPEKRLKKQRQRRLKKKEDPNQSIKVLSKKIYNTRCELKNTLDKIQGKLDITKEKVYKPENIEIGTIQNERQGEKIKTVKRAPVSCGTFEAL